MCQSANLKLGRFSWLFRKLKIRKFQQNAAQVCLKRVVFLNNFSILFFELENFMSNLYGKKYVFADLRKFKSANHTKVWVRNSQIPRIARLLRVRKFNKLFKSADDNRKICGGVRFSEIIITNSQSNRQCIHKRRLNWCCRTSVYSNITWKRGFVNCYPRTLLNATYMIPITDIHTKKSRCENIITLNKQIVYSDNFLPFRQRRMYG